jgi:hypothetical protein
MRRWVRKLGRLHDRSNEGKEAGENDAKVSCQTSGSANSECEESNHGLEFVKMFEKIRRAVKRSDLDGALNLCSDLIERERKLNQKACEAAGLQQRAGQPPASLFGCIGKY